MKLPRHLAIIMDGNGRWAEGRGHNRIFGHVRGAKVARQIIESSAQKGIKNLTLFTFSTENWLRPKDEVHFLMSLLARKLKRETETLIENNIRFHCIGDLSRLPQAVQAQVKDTIRATEGCTGMNLSFAISYGGRQEITAAARRLAEKAVRGEIRVEDIDESTLAAQMDSSFMPDPDFIIRTSGENRISNFYLWQAAYSEIYFTPVSWPDFSEAEFLVALENFDRRERRFGKTQPHQAQSESTRQI